jgi:YD repeat-containing protein
MKVNAATESYAFGYDALGNLMSRTGTAPDMTYAYDNQPAVPNSLPAVEGGPQAVTRVDNSVGADWSYDYDARGNLDDKYEGNVLTYDYEFDVEGRLTSVATNNETTTFAYDAGGQRVLTTRHDGVLIYTPFPDYEMEDPPGAGGETFRITYRLAGQMVAVRAAGVLYYTLTDHLGNVLLLAKTDGSILAGSAARIPPVVSACE